MKSVSDSFQISIMTPYPSLIRLQNLAGDLLKRVRLAIVAARAHLPVLTSFHRIGFVTLASPK